MTKDQAIRLKIGDVILVGVHKDRPAVVRAIYRYGLAPPYFSTIAEPGLTSWKLAELPAGAGAEDGA